MTRTSSERRRASSAHTKSVSAPLEDVVRFLREHLGTTLVAFITDKNVSTISRWGTGSATPRDTETERRLRATFQVVELLQAEEAYPTIRAWFMGMNPQLDDASPAEALQEGKYREVMASARAFLSGG